MGVPPLPELIGTNLVVKFSLSNFEIKYAGILHRLPGFTFNLNNPLQFIVHMNHVTMTIFNNGDVTSTGAKSAREGLQYAQRLCNLLCSVGVPVNIIDFTPANIPYTYVTGFPLRIEAMSEAFTMDILCPSAFSGYIFRLGNSSITIEVYRSGKGILVGASSEEEAYEAWSHFFYKVALPFRGNESKRSKMSAMNRFLKQFHGGDEVYDETMTHRLECFTGHDYSCALFANDETALHCTCGRHNLDIVQGQLSEYRARL